MPIRRLTVKERIQLHLIDCSRFSEDYEAPAEVTQEGIARAVGIRVHHVLQYLRPLVQDELIEGRTSHIKSRARRRKVYFLTAKGRLQTASMRSRLLKESVIAFRRIGGQIEELSLAQVFQEHRRGAALLELLQEVEALGSVAEAPGTTARTPVDHTQEAPPVERFYGRATDLAAALRAVETKPMVVVTGMAGMGKTSFAAKVCDELRPTRPLFWRQIRPWDTAMDLAFRLAVFLRALGRTELHGALVGPGTRDMSQVEDRLAKDLAGTSALVVLDDVHSASADAQQFVRALLLALKRASGASALLTSRTVPTLYSRREVAIERSVVELVLPGLDRESSMALLADAGVSDPLLGSLADACGGVPLFLILLASTNVAGRPGEGWKTLGTYVAEEIEETLDEAERGCLEAASFCHVSVPIDVLLVESGARTNTIVGLERKGLITPVGPDRFVVHETLRDYFRSGLSEERRAALIEAVVPRLLDAARDAETRGRLSEATAYVGNAAFIETDRERRRLCWRKLADLRRYVGDLPGAIDAYRTALGDAADAGDRARLSEKIAACLHAQGHFEEAESTIEEGLRLLAGHPSVEAAWLLFRRADMALSRDDYDRAFEIVERVIGWMTGLPKDNDLWGSLANLRGSIHLDDPKRADYALAYADFREALRAWEVADNRGGASRACNNLGLATVYLGRPDEALTYFNRSAEIADASGDLLARLKALFVKAWFVSECQGDYDAAEKLYQETYRLAKETHQRERLVYHYYHLAEVYRHQGRYQEARESLDYFLGAARDMMNSDERAGYLSTMVRLCVLSGDASAAQPYLEQAEAIQRAVPSDLTAHHVDWAKAAMSVGHGDLVGAAANYGRAFNHVAQSFEGEFLLEYGRFLASVGRAAEAREVLVRAREAFARHGMKPMAAETDGVLRTIGASVRP